MQMNGQPDSRLKNSLPQRQPKETKSAFSLLELLFAIGIIAILASLLLGAALKAKRYARHKTFEITAHDAIAHTEQEMGGYYENKTNFPALTADELNRRGVFDLHTMDFLSNPEVTFYPFSSTDTDYKVILQVVISSNDFTVFYKTNAMRPPEE